MRKMILTSHGHLAEGMQSAVNMILGCQADLEVYDLDHYEEPDMILEQVRKRVEKRQRSSSDDAALPLPQCLRSNGHVLVDGPGNPAG